MALDFLWHRGVDIFLSIFLSVSFFVSGTQGPSCGVGSRHPASSCGRKSLGEVLALDLDVLHPIFSSVSTGLVSLHGIPFPFFLLLQEVGVDSRSFSASEDRNDMFPFFYTFICPAAGAGL